MIPWSKYKSEAKERGALALEVYIAVSTPTHNLEKVKEILPKHLAYQRKLEANGSLMFAGPLSDLSGENMDGTGMIIYKVKNIDEAKKLAEEDPMHAQGVRSFTLQRWLINEGNLKLELKLSAQSIQIATD